MKVSVVTAPGETTVIDAPKPTVIYFDAAGAPAAIETALISAKTGARLGVAVHKQPVPVDFLNLMSNEITIAGSMGYPDEIFKTATTPGAADKVVVTFN
jgi:threonine dehydrogenase-like Zn-dependent dehydrogenase